MSASSRSTYRRGKTVQTTETPSECRRGLLGVRVGPRLRSLRLFGADAAPICTTGATGCRPLVGRFAPVRVLFLSAKHLFYSAKARMLHPKNDGSQEMFWG